jgi:hypothetical protein
MVKAGASVRRSPRNTVEKNAVESNELGDAHQQIEEGLQSKKAALTKECPRSKSNALSTESDGSLIENKAASQSTTSRRGGKSASPRNSSPRKSSRRTGEQNNCNSSLMDDLPNHNFSSGGKEQGTASNSPSSAAAAAADAAAKLLSESQSQGGFSWFRDHAKEEVYNRQGTGNSSTPFSNEKFFDTDFGSEQQVYRRSNELAPNENDIQSVFRRQAQPIQSNFRITTKSQIGIKKPKTTESSTVRVMGSHTATHIRYRPPEPTHHNNVFRENTFSDGMDGEHLLLSLKSGSRSFDMLSGKYDDNQSGEDSPNKGFKGESDDVCLSPEEPPQIQHAHYQTNKADSFLFDQKALKTPRSSKGHRGLEDAPSFTLFNHSFDSFCDDPYLRSPPTGAGTFIDSAIRPALSFMQGEDSSPRKSPFVSNSMSHSSPLKQKTPHHESDEDRSLDEAIVKSMNDPLLYKSENTMVLPVSKTIREIPITLETPNREAKRHPRIHSSERPRKEDSERIPLPYGAPYPDDNVGAHRLLQAPPQGYPVMNPHVGSAGHHFPMDSPAPGYPFPHHFEGIHTPSRFIHPVSHDPSVYQGRTRVPTSYMHQSQRSMYRPQRRPTSLIGLEPSTIYDRLSCHRECFAQFEFLLPSGKHKPKIDSSRGSNNEKTIESSEDQRRRERLVARQRVVSALCAFGGNGSRYRNSILLNNQSLAEVNEKEVICSQMSQRFYEHENRISWEVEEDPPVQTPSNKRKSTSNDSDNKTPKKNQNESLIATITPDKSNQPKMRYRCKLCGLPKQNHKCRFQKSIQRSIGVNVYSAVNAFTSAEPGDLAPALNEMNNFIATEMADSTPSRSKSETYGFSSQNISIPVAHVSPENARSIAPSSEEYDRMSSTRRVIHTPMRNIRRTKILSPDRNLSSPNNTSGSLKSDFVFRESIQLRPEQYRHISQNESESTDFVYPAIPLPYGQRKSLADNLFQLSREMPSLTDECAQILRKARENDKWDVAVAELLTQLLCVIHCPVEDLRMEGLSRYMLSLGFSC